MLDTLTTSLQRSFGEASVVFGMQAGQVALRRLKQVGSAKAILPKTHGPVPEVVFLNTAGGLTGGDRFSYGIDVGARCGVVATTQTAERGYASLEGHATVDVRMTVGRGGRLDWLPQETILFNRASLRRDTTIDLAEGASGLFLETVVLGRAAMGETVRDISFCDTRMIRRAGRPVFFELVLIATGAEDAAPALRQLLTIEGVTGAVSGFDGKCIVRLMAADGWPLRQQLLKLLLPLQRQAPPRVWQQ